MITKFKTTSYWNYPDFEVYDIRRSAFEEIKLFKADRVERGTHDGDYVLVQICTDGKRYVITACERYDSLEAAQYDAKACFVGNYLNSLDGTTVGGWVADYEIWRVVSDPRGVTLRYVYQPYILAAYIGYKFDDYDCDRLVDAVTGLDAAGVRRWKDLDDAEFAAAVMSCEI